MRTLSIVVAGALLLSVAQSQGATLLHDYQLNDANDTLGGPSLTSNGGSFVGGQYVFGAGQGLNLAGALPAAANGNYSIYLRAAWQDVNGYKRYVDFKDFTSDTGFYNLNSGLVFYGAVGGPGGVISSNTPHDIVITRDGATGNVFGYVDGAQQFTFVDSNEYAVFSVGDAVMHFFQDDTSVGGEHGPGSVDRIQIFSGALTASEVTALPVAVVPEPMAAMPMMAAATLLVRRRR